MGYSKAFLFANSLKRKILLKLKNMEQMQTI